MSLGTQEPQKELNHWFASNEDFKVEEKREAVKKLCSATSAAEASQDRMQNYTQQAFQLLETLEVNEQGSNVLRTFANQMMQRQF